VDQVILIVAIGAALLAFFLLLSFCALKAHIHRAQLDQIVNEEKKRRKRAAMLTASPIEVS
jgi:CBS domain containing-hemolysin-like protein